MLLTDGFWSLFWRVEGTVGIHVTHVWRGHSQVGVTHVWREYSCVGLTHMWRGHLPVEVTHVWRGHFTHLCGTSHQSEILHSLYTLVIRDTADKVMFSMR